MTTHEETGRRVGATAAGRPRSIPSGRNPHTMTTDPNTAALARIRQMADHWEQRLPDVIRTAAVVSALRAALESAEPPAAGLGVSATPIHTELAARRERYAAAIRSAGETAYGNRPFYEAITEAVLAVAGAERIEARAAALREAADRYAKLADQNEAYDREQGDLDAEARLQHGTVRDVAAGLRRLADEAQQQEPTETEAHPPYHRWYTETRDGLAEEWAPGMRFTDRAEALARFETVSRNHPLWKDGTPVRRRFVRETTSYTVEQPDAAPQPEPSVHGESVAHLAGLHDDEPAVEVLRIVSDWCVEANENGGVDAGDLAWRLEQAGYPLPDGAQQ